MSTFQFARSASAATSVKSLVSARSRIAMLTLVILFADAANAANPSFSCNHVFQSDLQPTSNVIYETSDSKEFKEAFYRSLIAENPIDDITLTWSVPYPAGRRKLDSGATQLSWGGKRNRDLVGIPNDPEHPLIAISRMSGRTSIRSDEFYENVYGNYEGTIRDDLIEKLHSVDEELEPERVSAAQVYRLESKNEANSANDSTIRIYDSSEKPFALHFEPGSAMRTVGGTLLPFQRINAKRGLPRLTVDEFLDDAKKRGVKVFEIGKFSINGPPSLRQRIRILIELIFLEHFATLYPDAIFVTHTASNAHARLYEAGYDMRVAERFDAPGSPEGEAILWVEGHVMAAKLRKRLGLPATSVTRPDVARLSLPLLDTLTSRLQTSSSPKSQER